MNLTIELHTVAAGDLPDADTDVLLWAADSPEAQLGALDCTAPLVWVNAQGEEIVGVTHWAHMPSIRASVVEPSAWLHVYRQIGGGARYEEATVGDSRHYDHPAPKEGFKWIESRALYEDVTLRGDPPLPAPEARELGTVPLPGGGVVRLDGPWALPR